MNNSDKDAVEFIRALDEAVKFNESKNYPHFRNVLLKEMKKLKEENEKLRSALT